MADMEAGGLQDIKCETVTLTQAVADWALFAHGLVIGNPVGPARALREGTVLNASPGDGV